MFLRIDEIVGGFKTNVLNWLKSKVENNRSAQKKEASELVKLQGKVVHVRSFEKKWTSRELCWICMGTDICVESIKNFCRCTNEPIYRHKDCINRYVAREMHEKCPHCHRYFIEGYTPNQRNRRASNWLFCWNAIVLSFLSTLQILSQFSCTLNKSVHRIWCTRCVEQVMLDRSPFLIIFKMCHAWNQRMDTLCELTLTCNVHPSSSFSLGLFF